MTQIKLVLFDLLGVLIEDSFISLFKFISKEKGVDYISFMEDNRFDLDELMKGNLTEKEFYTKLIQKYELHEDLDFLLEKLKTGFAKIEESFEILEELKEKNVRMAVLSNMSGDFIEFEKELIQSERFFEKVFFSAQIGCKKPQKEAFEYALNNLNLKPEEIVFVDDKEKNTKVADFLGFKTIVCKNPESIKKGLIEFEAL